MEPKPKKDTSWHLTYLTDPPEPPDEYWDEYTDDDCDDTDTLDTDD